MALNKLGVNAIDVKDKRVLIRLVLRYTKILASLVSFFFLIYTLHCSCLCCLLKK